MRSTVASHWKSTTTKWEAHEADPLKTTQDFAKELNINHSVVVWHLKQIEKVKNIDKWVPPDLTKGKKNVLLKYFLLFYATTDNFLVRLWCAMKSGFYSITGDNQLSGWTEKKLQSTSQSQTCTPKKVMVTGSLLPVWSPIDL